MYKEHPKMLYQGDKTRIAANVEAEELLRLDGWHDYGQEPEPVTEPEPTPEPQAEKPKPAPRKTAAKPQAEA